MYINECTPPCLSLWRVKSRNKAARIPNFSPAVTLSIKSNGTVARQNQLHRLHAL